jgi:DNA uptake protein ComE-like DNA-binding protein
MPIFLTYPLLIKAINHFFMRKRLFYWLKTSLGFSNKESRGFLLLTPLLLLMAASPYLFESFRKENREDFLKTYQFQLDSLESLNLNLQRSPNPLFNPADTATKPSSAKKTQNLIKMDFVDADSVVLQIVPGIGVGLSGRIIKYRERLGGFHSENQLSEIYGLKPETIEEIWNYFDFSPTITKRISINSAEIEEVSAHPYISYSEAKVLIAYRKQHGNYSSVADLKKIKIFKPEWIDKIEPYLSFD